MRESTQGFHLQAKGHKDYFWTLLIYGQELLVKLVFHSFQKSWSQHIIVLLFQITCMEPDRKQKLRDGVSSLQGLYKSKRWGLQFTSLQFTGEMLGLQFTRPP